MKNTFSRTAVDLYCECPRCFYLQHKLKIKRPPGYPFTLNAAVDKLTKAEFDLYRVSKREHPLIQNNGLEMIPLEHPDLNHWRNNRKGVRIEYQGYEFYGIVDDIWVHTSNKKWHVVEYKATAKKDPVTSLDPNAEHHRIYQKQVAFYTWLLIQNAHPVDLKCFFVYSTGDNQATHFNDTLSFRTSLIEHTCDTSWVEPTLSALIRCFESPIVPEASASCKHCEFSRLNNQQ